MKAFLFLFILTSCFPLMGNITNSLYYSIPRQDVLNKFGTPSYIQRYYSKEILVYYLHDSIFNLFISSKVPFIGFFPFIRTGKEFYIILEDNKAVSFGYRENYNNQIPKILSYKSDIFIDK